MTAAIQIKEGDTVYLREGVSILLREAHADTDVEWDRIPYAEDISDVPFTVERIGVSHATMNGGGRDYMLVEYADGYPMWNVRVRTTFANPESAVFSLTPTTV